MAGVVNVRSELSSAWQTLSAYWRDDNASAFHNRYVLSMEEAVGRFDTACMELDDLTDSFSAALEDFRRNLDV